MNNRLQQIIQREKATQYTLPHKDSFAFAVMAHITAQQAQRKTMRKLVFAASLMGVVVSALLLLWQPNVGVLLHFSLNQLLGVIFSLFLQSLPTTLTLAAMAGLCVLCLKLTRQET